MLKRKSQWCVRVIFFDSESQALWVRVEPESSQIFSSQSQDFFESQELSSRLESLVSKLESMSIQTNFHFHVFQRNFFAMKWHSICHKVAPDKLENSAQHASDSVTRVTDSTQVTILVTRLESGWEKWWLDSSYFFHTWTRLESQSITGDSRQSHFYKISEFLMDKPTSFAHKEMSIFSFSDNRDWRKFSVLPV